MTADDANLLFSARSSVVASELSNGSALLDMSAGKYYSLNVVGTHVWKDIQSPSSLQSLVVSVVEKFDVGVDDCRRDIAGLLTSLIGAGLVEVTRVEAIEAVG